MNFFEHRKSSCVMTPGHSRHESLHVNNLDVKQRNYFKDGQGQANGIKSILEVQNGDDGFQACVQKVKFRA